MSGGLNATVSFGTCSHACSDERIIIIIIIIIIAIEFPLGVNRPYTNTGK
jgi:hypothetical protein